MAIASGVCPSPDPEILEILLKREYDPNEIYEGLALLILFALGLLYVCMVWRSG